MDFLINEAGDVFLKRRINDVRELKSLLAKTKKKIDTKKMNQIIAKWGRYYEWSTLSVD